MKAAKRKSASPRRKTGPVWQLRLYVTDQTPKSRAALSNLRKICKTHLNGRFHITTIDLLKNPRRAKTDQILATPTLVRRLPIPMRTIIGNLSDIDNVLVGLELRAAPLRDRTAEKRPE